MLSPPFRQSGDYIMTAAVFKHFKNKTPQKRRFVIK
jgi:hypothetical protein